jgi:hypothetical protein
MASRYVPPPQDDFVPPSEEWQDEYDAQTEMSVAAPKHAGVEVHSSGRGGGSAPPVSAAVAAAGFSAEELAALAEDGE